MLDEKWINAQEIAQLTSWWNLPKAVAMMLYVISVTFCQMLDELQKIRRKLEEGL
jgi:hypothetical protein